MSIVARIDDLNAALYQWDTGQRVLLTGVEAGTNVDFGHPGGELLGVKTYEDDGLIYADIPNILLQQTREIRMYVYIAQGAQGETVYARSFRVLPREKPTDYVYTETEIHTWTALEARVDRLEQSGGGGGGTVKSVNGVFPDKDGNVEIEIPEGPQGGGGMSSAAASLLVEILRNGVFTSNQGSNITALEAALASGGSDGPETPDRVIYTITNILTNVTNSNISITVGENAAYSAILSAEAGYTLESVLVTMGGVDVTDSVYADGSIIIPAVTGNLIITATAVESSTGSSPELNKNGLLAFFDLRNSPAGAGNNLTGYYRTATIGEGRFYGWYTFGTTSEYGGNIGDFCTGQSYSAHNFGNEFSWILKTYSGASLSTILGCKNYIDPSNFGAMYSPTYNTSDGTSRVSAENIGYTNAGKYKCVEIVCKGKDLKLYLDGVLAKSDDGSVVEGFSSWWSKLGAGAAWSKGSDVPVYTAVACYYRALSEVEIVEMDEYMRTLEVL